MDGELRPDGFPNAPQQEKEKQKREGLCWTTKKICWEATGYGSLHSPYCGTLPLPASRWERPHTSSATRKFMSYFIPTEGAHI
ncbi:hypothetical protein CPSG_02752 [Coccidioides posadasii str. Silveira]|uniref:Uncharacterized protein n=1 Tax=Coccidioides posadasii (strain RMSCC 757 / Silveira) TaxID=443226 RepID=E9CY82_COCPS|nr:hypothetical protein CPSG_02752 [Coccidioides posadasii str. Silveira]